MTNDVSDPITIRLMATFYQKLPSPSASDQRSQPMEIIPRSRRQCQRCLVEVALADRSAVRQEIPVRTISTVYQAVVRLSQCMAQCLPATKEVASDLRSALASLAIEPDAAAKQVNLGLLRDRGDGDDVRFSFAIIGALNGLQEKYSA